MLIMSLCHSHKPITLLVFYQRIFFAYLQIRHYINTNVKSTQDTVLLGPIEKLIIKFTLKKGSISYFYNGLQNIYGSVAAFHRSSAQGSKRCHSKGKCSLSLS